MKSDSEIRYDFQQAIRKAEELEGIAANLKRLANNDLENSLQALSGAWKGEAARTYLLKGNNLQAKILSNAKKLESTARTIRSVAKRTYNAEMAAYRIAKEREYRHGVGNTNN